MNYIPDEIDFPAYWAATEHKALVLKAIDFDEDLKKSYRRKDNQNRIYLPWQKTKLDFDFRPGEVTVWAGQNGSGKTMLTIQVLMSLISQEQSVCVASLEIKPEKTLQRMLRMFTLTNPNVEENMDEAAIAFFDEQSTSMLEWAKKLYIFNKFGDCSPETILGMVKYCGEKLGIQHVIIDNLQKCIRGSDDYNAEKGFVADLFNVAQEAKIHVHLVHHTRKPSKETNVPDKSDIKGSGAITDIVDNIFMVHRNKEKEDGYPFNLNISWFCDFN
jgi:twinkle protein